MPLCVLKPEVLVLFLKNPPPVPLITISITTVRKKEKKLSAMFRSHCCTLYPLMGGVT